MMDKSILFNDDDLEDLFKEFTSEENKTEEVKGEEMEASERRYKEIIKKRNEENGV